MSQGTGRARGRGGRGKKPQQQEPPPPGPAAPPQVSQPPPPGGGGAAPGSAVGRGRARGKAARQAAEAQTVQAAAAPMPVQEQALPPAEGHIGGRGIQRGGGRERGAGEPPVGEMGAMSIGGDRRPYMRRAAWEKFVDHKYKPDDKEPWGKTGDRVTLQSNYFNVTLPSERKIYQYAVDFKPEIENARVKFALIATYSQALGDVKCFDGGLLYICKLLAQDVTTFTATRNTDNAPIRVTLTFKNEVLPSSPQFLQIANLMFKRVQVALDMNRIRDHYYNLALSVKVPRHKLEVVPGFVASILSYEGGSLLGVDITHKIIRIDTFLDCLYDLYESQRFEKVELFHAMALKTFVGSIVMTRYNNKTYRVDDIFWDGRPSSTFEKGGEKITYQEYYKTHWNITIQDKDQPLLVTRPTEKDFRRGDKQNLYLLPELCTITGLSEAARSDINIMRDLAVHTRIGPEDRLRTLENFLAQINSSPKVAAVLNPWQISIEAKPAEIPARQLASETLVMRNKRKEIHKFTYQIKEADWGRQMRDTCVLTPVDLDLWVVIYPLRSEGPSAEFVSCLKQVGKGLGMNVADPVLVKLEYDRNDTYLQAIRHNLNPRVKIVLCVVPNNKKDRYDAIKKCCCIDNPVPSQVVLVKTISKKQGLMSVATKVAIQMNCKMGGEIWGAEIPLKGLMVVGIDAYHDSGNKGSSVGALVASLNRECTRYYSKTEVHPTKQEVMTNLSVLFAAALRKYHEVNGAAPQKIVIYRDGVGDGQLLQVFTTEKGAIDDAVKAAGGSGYTPGISYIVVKKRINTRLFGRDKGKLGNPQPGTVVDQFVTKPDWYDFFLISQSVRQGTVTPTSYNVLFDETGLQPDHVQRLSYKLTHLYFNWQGTIRVPAPCQYAHKLAFLQGQSLHREFSAYLSDKLFYL